MSNISHCRGLCHSMNTTYNGMHMVDVIWVVNVVQHTVNNYMLSFFYHHFIISFERWIFQFNHMKFRLSWYMYLFLQASSNTVLSHFLGLVFSMELLRSITLSQPPPDNVIPKLTWWRASYKFLILHSARREKKTSSHTSHCFFMQMKD